MELVETRLAALVKESRDQIALVVEAISGAASVVVPADKVAVALACRLDGDKHAPLLSSTLAVMDVLSIRIKENQDVLAAEVLGYFFRMLQPEQVMARACLGASSAIKARVKGYLKRWVTRDCLTQQRCDEIVAAIDAGAAVPVPAPSLSEGSATDAGEGSVSSSVPKDLVDAVRALLGDLTATMQKAPLDDAVAVGQRIAQLRFAGLLPLEHPTADTIVALNALVGELRASVDRDTKLREAEAAAEAGRRATHALTDSDVASPKGVVDLADLLHQRQDSAAAERLSVAADAAAPSYRKSLESDVAGHVGRIYAQPGHEFLLGGRAPPSDAAPYQPARAEVTIRRPFRVPSRQSTTGYYRTWGISDEQWAVEKDMSRIAVVQPRGVSLTGAHKRARE